MQYHVFGLWLRALFSVKSQHPYTRFFGMFFISLNQDFTSNRTSFEFDRDLSSFLSRYSIYWATPKKYLYEGYIIYAPYLVCTFFKVELFFYSVCVVTSVVFSIFFKIKFWDLLFSFIFFFDRRILTIFKEVMTENWFFSSLLVIFG